MNLLETLLQTRVAAALGWMLVHSLWEGAMISLALAVALYFLRTSRARYAAACLAMLFLRCRRRLHLRPLDPATTNSDAVAWSAWPPACRAAIRSV